MAHFAEINNENIVQRVIVVDNSILLDGSGKEVEQKGIDFCKSLLGGNWLQTSYNGKIRKMYAGVGFRYVPADDVFLPADFHSLKEYEDFIVTLSEAQPLPQSPAG